jgi:hypothetical protein
MAGESPYQLHGNRESRKSTASEGRASVCRVPLSLEAMCVILNPRSVRPTSTGHLPRGPVAAPGSADGDRGIRGNDTTADTLGAGACDVAKKHHGAAGQQRQIP